MTTQGDKEEGEESDSGPERKKNEKEEGKSLFNFSLKRKYNII